MIELRASPPSSRTKSNTLSSDMTPSSFTRSGASADTRAIQTSTRLTFARWHRSANSHRAFDSSPTSNTLGGPTCASQPVAQEWPLDVQRHESTASRRRPTHATAAPNCSVWVRQSIQRCRRQPSRRCVRVSVRSVRLVVGMLRRYVSVNGTSGWPDWTAQLQRHPDWEMSRVRPGQVVVVVACRRRHIDTTRQSRPTSTVATIQMIQASGVHAPPT